MFELSPSLQAYDWGKRDGRSIISRLGLTSTDGPCAEAWYGSHPKSPSSVLIDGKTKPLTEVEDALGTALLGHELFDSGVRKLPFLVKLLSIEKALSIQVHPDEAFASILHAEKPAIYPERNPKPEIGIALSRVTQLNGIRPKEEIDYFLRSVPELQALCGANGEVRELIGRALQTPAAETGRLAAQLKERVMRGHYEHPEEQLFVTLAREYPDDVGLFFVFLLNVVDLWPGQALFTPPRRLHAYLSGEVFEVMRMSDLVVRAGLTPKAKDVETLLRISEFASATPNVLTPTPKPLSPNLWFYECPSEDFSVAVCRGDLKLRTEGQPHLLISVADSLLITGRYEAKRIRQGHAVLLPADEGDYSLKCRETFLVTAKPVA